MHNERKVIVHWVTGSKTMIFKDVSNVDNINGALRLTIDEKIVHVPYNNVAYIEFV
jgi:hypothetical protein